MNVEKFWQDVINQNRSSLSSFFREDAVIRWHCTNEQFTVSEYIQANCDYPGKWKGNIERVEEYDSQMIIVGKVQSDDETIQCHVISFILLRDDKIIEMDEYWADDGEPPAWRKALQIGTPIR